jgi:hypothetical protein
MTANGRAGVRLGRPLGHRLRRVTWERAGQTQASEFARDLKRRRAKVRGGADRHTADSVHRHESSQAHTVREHGCRLRRIHP